MKFIYLYFGDVMNDEKQDRIEALFKERGPILKTHVLREYGICSRDLAELTKDNLIQKLKTGYYMWNAMMPDISDAETAVVLIPFGVVCLQSAAMFHELATVNPIAVTIAVPANRTRIALPKYPPVETVAYPLPTFGLGITETGNLRVYDMERTVYDFFRKRRQLGDDLAIEVLRTYMRGTKNLQTLLDYAGKLHIKGIIKPYMEALL
jgi:predicted transcriptional regulator of viral defense system